MVTTTGTSVNFYKVNTKAQYDDLTIAPGTIYFVSSERKIYLDGVGYGMSDDDAANFLSIDGGTLNGSLYIDDGMLQIISGEGDRRGISFVVPEDVGAKKIEPYNDGGTDYGLQIEAGLTTYKFSPSGLSLNGALSDIKISGLADPINDDEAVNKRVLDAEITAIRNMRGANNGLAALDEHGYVPSGQLPSYVDDVVEYPTLSGFPDGEAGKIYVALDTKKIYRWSGSEYTEISKSLALGSNSSSAFYGHWGQAAYDHSLLESGNPHKVTKANVGLSNVENYAVASEAEAKAGLLDNRYMTPQKTRSAIQELAPKITWTVVS